MTISYLVDTSAVWRILRSETIRMRWLGTIESGLVGLSSPTRLELLLSATGPADRDEFDDDLSAFGDVPVPKTAWRWAEMAQHALTQHGQHRGPGPVDLVICATAVHHGLTVLHADQDFATVAKVLPELSERNIER